MYIYIYMLTGVFIQSLKMWMNVRSVQATSVIRMLIALMWKDHTFANVEKDSSAMDFIVDVCIDLIIFTFETVRASLLFSTYIVSSSIAS